MKIVNILVGVITCVAAVCLSLLPWIGADLVTYGVFLLTVSFGLGWLVSGEKGGKEK